jgi:hypothetical protein
MFNALQEGIIVIDDNRYISFMNELSNRVLSELTNVKNIFKAKTHSGNRMQFDPIDQKLFFLFTSNSQTDSKTTRRRKASSQSDSKHGSESSKQEQTEFSLRDLSLMPTKDLNSKIFTFDKKLATHDMTKMVGEGKNIEKVVKGLPSMKGIEEEFVPKFKFIQFKKSSIKSFD